LEALLVSMENMCSWNGMEMATMHFCEELRCGTWLVQPANAISNISFVFVGIYLLSLIKNKKSIYLLFPISAILVGITSFLYHASWTFFFQVFDVSSMFMLSCLLLSFNLWRLKIIQEKSLPMTYAALVVASALSMIIIKGKWGEILFAIEVIVLLFSEIYLSRKIKGTHYANFLKALGTFVLAFTIWTLDVKEIVCVKDNHILQGHALWHILNSICFIFLYKFYAQFKKE
jgi:hypothetical protein